MGEVLWLTATRFHDWSDRRFLTELLDRAADLGVIGPATWARSAVSGPPKPVILSRPGLGAKLLARVPKRHKILWLQAGGVGWRVLLLVPPFARAANRVNGMCIASIFFDGTPFADATGSDRLWEGFRSAHSPEDTEFAGLHPSARWDGLRRGPYSPAVTYDPMFAGVFWATYLGPGHIQRFDRAALGDLAPAREVTWLGDRGLFLRVNEELGSATTPETEARMFELTARFRDAIKDDGDDAGG